MDELKTKHRLKRNSHDDRKDWRQKLLCDPLENQAKEDDILVNKPFQRFAEYCLPKKESCVWKDENYFGRKAW